MLPKYQTLYEQNQDLIGWLTIEDTVIDYPVMQTPEDENYYLKLDFNKEPNENGCLIMDTDSIVGMGTAPSTNLIIHGHTMKSGQMFGDLDLYQDKEYGLSHATICFDSLYEKREYELIAVFYSQVYKKVMMFLSITNSSRLIQKRSLTTGIKILRQCLFMIPM